MELLVTVANVLNVTAFFVKERLWVRGLALTATCCFSIYLTTGAGAMPNAMYWNLVFVALNAFVLWRLVAERLHSGQASANGSAKPAAPAGDDSAAAQTAREDRSAS